MTVESCFLPFIRRKFSFFHTVPTGCETHFPTQPDSEASYLEVYLTTHLEAVIIFNPLTPNDFYVVPHS